MGLGRGVVWLFLRNTKWGSRYLYGPEQAAYKLLMLQIAERAWGQSQQYRDYQSRREADSRRKFDAHGNDVAAGRNEWTDGEFLVSVTDGYSRNYNCYVTDVIIAPRDHSGDRYHVILDSESGAELYAEYHQKK